MKNLENTKLNLFGLSESEKKIAYHAFMELTKENKSKLNEMESYPEYIYFDGEFHFSGSSIDDFNKLKEVEIKPVFSTYWEGILETESIKVGDVIRIDKGQLSKVIFVGDSVVVMRGIIGGIGEHSVLLPRLRGLRKEVTSCEFKEVKPSLDRKAEVLFGLMISQFSSDLVSPCWGELDDNQKEAWKCITKNLDTIISDFKDNFNV